MVSLELLHILRLPQPVFFHSENLTQPTVQPRVPYSGLG